MTARIMLEARLDTSAASKLMAQIETAEGNDLVLDASGVEMLGGLCLEAILNARHRWSQAEASFCVENGSEAFVIDLGTLGLGIDELGYEVVTA